VLNVKKSQKYFRLIAVVSGLLVLIKLLATPPPSLIAIAHSPSIDQQVTNLLPKTAADAPPRTVSKTAAVMTPTPLTPPPLSSSAELVIATPFRPVSPSPRLFLATQRSHSYQIAIPIHGAIARQYDDLAQQTGYLEQYPEISGTEMTDYQGQRLARDTAKAFERMRRAAAQERIALQVVSGFRSIRTQNEIFQGKGGGRQAAEYSAPPGHSQHHTGLAIDINDLSPSFRETAAFRWLHRHGAEYGFMLSYANTQGDLGPQAEPWHWVYVAKQPAMQLMSNFIERARQNNYDPLLGDRQLENTYHSATSLAIQIPDKSKS
jgi:zinc D-Ala-D-Ala carboxypeptidase